MVFTLITTAMVDERVVTERVSHAHVHHPLPVAIGIVPKIFFCHWVECHARPYLLARYERSSRTCLYSISISPTLIWGW